MTEAAGRVLCIDYGARRIGLALSDPFQMLASPLAVIDQRRQDGLSAVVAAISEQKPAKIILGLPTDSHGGVGPQAADTIRWARKLAAATDLPLLLYDETGTSRQAAAIRGRKARAGEALDALAAALILTEFLEAQRMDPHAGQALTEYDSIE